MRKLAILFLVSACAGPSGEGQSCEALARARADRQLERESALLEQQDRGPGGDSEVQRKLIEIDAEAYRKAVYGECLRRRDAATGVD